MDYAISWDSDSTYLEHDRVSVLGWSLPSLQADLSPPTAFPQLGLVLSALDNRRSFSCTDSQNRFDKTASSSDDSSLTLSDSGLNVSGYGSYSMSSPHYYPSPPLHSAPAPMKKDPMMIPQAPARPLKREAMDGPVVTYQCPLSHCTSTYKKRASLIGHLREDHGREGQEMARAMTPSFRRSEGPKNFACPEPNCGLRYVRKKDMYRHFRLKHSNCDPALLAPFRKQRKGRRPADRPAVTHVNSSSEDSESPSGLSDSLC